MQIVKNRCEVRKACKTDHFNALIFFVLLIYIVLTGSKYVRVYTREDLLTLSQCSMSSVYPGDLFINADIEILMDQQVS